MGKTSEMAQQNGIYPRVAITMGDPAGVGSEVVVKALANESVYSIVSPVVIGDAARLRRAAQICGIEVEVESVACPGDAAASRDRIQCIDLANVPSELPFGEVAAAGGEAAFQYIKTAATLASNNEVSAICTAPLNKEALHLAGHMFPGHTELLASLTGTEEVSMLLVSPELKVIHVTTHIGILDAVERINPALIERTVRRGGELLKLAGIPNPRIAVCGINPHAGENGLFGRGEEVEKIVPAMEKLQSEGWAIQGPLPADTLFFRARRGDFDLVVAMYHDQGHGPVKVLGLEVGVNVTVGLPFVRTSVDHGTAFDIAGTGKADPQSLIEALKQAALLAPVHPNSKL